MEHFIANHHASFHRARRNYRITRRQCRCTLLSIWLSSGDDRYVNLWHLESDSDSDAGARPALRAFVLDSAPLALEFSQAASKKRGTKGPPHFLVALTQSGVANIWCFEHGRKVPKTPSTQLRLKEAEDVSQSAQRILATRLGPEHTIHVALGIPPRPWFEHIQLINADSGEVEGSIELPRKKGGVSSMKEPVGQSGRSGFTESKGVSRGQQEAVVGPGAMKLPGGKDVGHTTKRKAKREPSLGQRAADESLEMTEAPATPRADSSAVLLTQALQNDDVALLEDCLSCRDHTMINNTVRRLPPTSVLPFLKQVCNRMRSKPGRATTLVPWVQAVLIEHTAYLTTVPAATGVLGDLFQAADARVAVFDNFLKLQGRLDLIMSHVSRRRISQGGDSNTAGHMHRELGQDDEDEDDLEVRGMDFEEEDEEDEDDDGDEDDEEVGNELLSDF